MRHYLLGKAFPLKINGAVKQSETVGRLLFLYPVGIPVEDFIGINKYTLFVYYNGVGGIGIFEHSNV